MTFAPVSPWSASPDRTAAVRTIGGARAPLRWPGKDPADLLDFSIFLHPSVADLDDTVASFTVAGAPAGVTVEAKSINGRVLTGWLSGGVAGQAYVVTWAATMASGRVLQAAGTIAVATAGSAAAAQPNAVVAFQAAVLALPTVSAGLLPGQAWIDAGTIKVVQ